MTAIARRVVILLSVVIGAWLAVAVVERRGRWRATTGGQRLVLITGDGCRLCGPAEAALRSHGLPVEVVDVREPNDFRPPRALPTAIVLDESLRIIMRRTGRSVIDDAGLIAATFAT